MVRHDYPTMADARELVRELRELAAVEAPPSLPANVLARLGLADAYWTLDTPLGPVFVAYNTLGVAAVTRAATAAEFADAFRARFGRPVYQAPEPPATLARAAAAALRGERHTGLRFDLRGLSEFERAVLLKALEIPRGEVRPYAWIAREIGHPRAVRAVGSALGHNPVPLLIPCHRVVRSDGQIGQYSMGGPEVKRAVLAAEGAAPDTIEALARAGVRYYGSDTTRIYCFPSCRHARRVSDRHLMRFSSAAQAAAAGYRPCKICRPAEAS
jgi:O-6-methylguanine DNA methyltransferase